MPKYLIDERDVSMGNEDRWDLVVDDALTEAHVDHVWSHREGSYEFKSGRKTLTLTECRNEDAGRYAKVAARLREVGFRGAIPS